MANTVIELRHSRATGNTPSSLANGELAINTYDGKLFYRGGVSNTIQTITRFTGPAGLDTELQFNDGGSLGGSEKLTFDKTTGLLTVNGTVRANIFSDDGVDLYVFSNNAFNTANAAFLAANSAATLSAATDLIQNNSITAVFTRANTAVENAGNASIYANGAFLAANSAATLSAATDATQNTNITLVTNTATAAFLAANSAATLSAATDLTQNNSITAAFTRANNSISANAGGTITGDLVVTGNLTISGQTTYSNTVQLLVGDNLITLNAELPTSVTPVENAGIEINRGNTFANSSLLWIEASGKWQANSGSSTGAYFLANEAVVTAAFLAANSSATLSAATDATQNANITTVTNTATAAFLAANSAATLSAATDATQNSSIAAAFNQANTDFTNVSVAAGTYGNTTHYGVVTVLANGRVTAVQTFVMQDPSALAFSFALG